MSSPRARATAFLVALLLVAGACSSGGNDTETGGATSSGSGSDNAADSGSDGAADNAADPGAGGDATGDAGGDDDGGNGGSTGSDDAPADDSDGPGSDGPAPVSPEQAASNAAANIDSLEATDDVRTYEVLDVGTGNPTTIADVVTGDRPVLLWFWAPH